MATLHRVSLEPRKTPLQKRSTVTVEAISEATIQVLLRVGADRLTTVRVAERAGVSVGTLYQYYPNKHSLLFAVLRRHLEQVAHAVEDACAASRHRPLRTMVESVVEAFLSAKLQRRDASVALYRISSTVDGELLVAKVTNRTQKAVMAMLRSLELSPSADVEFAAFMFLSTMAGVTRALLEAGAAPVMVRSVRNHLVILGEAYLRRALIQRTSNHSSSG
jgi:AcrR family transcriptional regulator